MYYKVNSTETNYQFWQNGSAFSGYFGTSQYTNTSNTFIWNLLDNSFLPGVYNYGEITMENTIHSITTLTNQNQYARIEFLNISNTTKYGFFEVMTNSTVGAGALRVYYCNSSYSSGNPAISPNCVNFGTLSATQTFGHTHTTYSKHQVFSMPINVTSGMLEGIKVTPISYYLLRGANSGTWYIYNIPNTSRTGAIRTTSNGGNSWTNQTYTIDSHIHQFSNDTSMWYYACANDTFGNQNCSTPRQDSLELGNLAPSSPEVYSPVEGAYNNSITINYTASESPNNYSIEYYNITLVNYPDQTYNLTIVSNNSNNLSYVWNISGVADGEYRIKVTANDSLGQSSFGLSSRFLIENTEPIYNLSDISISSNNSINSSFAKTGDSVRIFFNSSGLLSNVSVTVYSGDGLINNVVSIANTSTSYNATYIVNSSDLDGNIFFTITANNLNLEYSASTDSSSVEIDKTPPSLQIISPLSTTYSSTTQELNLSASDSYLSTTWYNWNGTNYTYTSAINIVFLEGTNVLYAYSNDSLGNLNYTNISFTITLPSNEEVTSQSASVGVSSPNIYYTDDDFPKDGNKFRLKYNDKIRFVVNSKTHTLSLTYFNYSFAKITIESEPIIVYLQRGIISEFDLNNDSIMDIKVRYEGVNNTRAGIFIQEIVYEEEKGFIQEVEEKIKEKVSKEWNRNYLFLEIATIIIIALALWFLLHKRARKKRYKLFGY